MSSVRYELIGHRVTQARSKLAVSFELVRPDWVSSTGIEFRSGVDAAIAPGYVSRRVRAVLDPIARDGMAVAEQFRCAMNALVAPAGGELIRFELLHHDPGLGLGIHFPVDGPFGRFESLRYHAETDRLDDITSGSPFTRERATDYLVLCRAFHPTLLAFAPPAGALL